MFDGADVTAATLKITDLATDAARGHTLDLSNVTATVNLADATDPGGVLSIDFAPGQAVTVSELIDQTLTIDIEDGDVDVDTEGAVTLTLNKDITTAIVVDTTADDIITEVNVTVGIAQSSLDVRAGTNNVTVSGSYAVSVDSTATAGEFNASGVSGVVTVTTAASLADVTTGSGADSITLATAANVANAGSGNDTVNVASDLDLTSAASVNGGSGTDTLSFNNGSDGSDFSAATVTGFEYIAIDTGETISLAGSHLDGNSIVFTDDGSLNVNKIGATLDLSNLVFADANATVTIDFATNKLTTLGATSATGITGTEVADTITTDDGADTIVSGDGDDTIVSDAGADTVLAGDGDDTIDGGAGADSLSGDAGGDTIKGGTGADTLNGGDDNDVLLAGTGADTTPEARATTVSAGGGFAIGDTLTATLFGKAITGTSTAASATSLTNALKTAIEADAVISKLVSVALSTSAAANDTITITSLVDGNFTNFSYAATGATSTAAAAVDGTASTDRDTVNGGDGEDFVHTAGGVDTVNLGAADDSADTVVILTLSEGADAISNFASGEDLITFAGDLLNNGTDTDTLVSIAADGATVDNRVFFEITDATVAGGADTAAEVATFLVDLTLTSITTGDDVVFAVNDGSDTYLWQFTEDGTAGLLGAEFTLVAKLVGVTNIADGDLAQID
jgi:Ca2+-binding RTX toxin-like protein